VLLPILGRPYGDALQSGEITLKYDADTGSFAAWYSTTSCRSIRSATGNAAHYRQRRERATNCLGSG